MPGPVLPMRWALVWSNYLAVVGCNYDLLKTHETRGGGGGDTRDLGGGGEGLRAVTHGDGVALGSNRLCAE